MSKFSEFLEEHRQGALDEELGAALADAVKSVREHGKSATITLKLKLGSKGSSMLTTIDDVVSVLPQPDREPAVYFHDQKGGLHRDDPTQQKLPLRTIGGVQ